jgi:hypothetical protein
MFPLDHQVDPVDEGFSGVEQPCGVKSLDEAHTGPIGIGAVLLK